MSDCYFDAQHARDLAEIRTLRKKVALLPLPEKTCVVDGRPSSRAFAAAIEAITYTQPRLH